MIINICCFIIGLATGFIICTRFVVYALKKELEKEIAEMEQMKREPRIDFK
jgi:uncharacterized membrane-anchored protein YhcB (DUF1043 family)